MLWNKGGLRIKLGSTWISPQISLFSVIFVNIAMGSSFDFAKIYCCAVFRHLRPIQVRTCPSLNGYFFFCHSGGVWFKVWICVKLKRSTSQVWFGQSYHDFFTLLFFTLQGKISTDYKIMLHLTFHILITTYEVYFVCIFFVALYYVSKLKWVCGLTQQQLNYYSDNVNNTANDSSWGFILLAEISALCTILEQRTLNNNF